MRFLSFLSIVLINAHCFAQKPKKESIQTYQHKLPSHYLSEDYNSYSAIFELEGDKKIYVDGTYAADAHPMIHNEFWKKEDVFVQLALLKFLKFEIDPTVKKEDKLLIKVGISNARIDVTIDEDKNQEYPFTYVYNWSVDVITVIKNSLTSEEVHNEKKVFGDIFKHGGATNKKGYKSKFKTYKEAKAYVIENVDKSLISNEFYKNVDLTTVLTDSYDTRFFLQDPMPFWTISKENKFPVVASLNNTVKETVENIEKLNKSYPKTLKFPPLAKAKGLIREGKALGFKFSNDTLGLGYRNKLNLLLENLIIESDNLIPQLNRADKKEKAILWAMFMNKATASYVTAKYTEAKNFLEQAKELDYNKNRTGNLDASIRRASQSYDLLLSGKTKSGQQMNPKYFVYRTE